MVKDVVCVACSDGKARSTAGDAWHQAFAHTSGSAQERSERANAAMLAAQQARKAAKPATTVTAAKGAPANARITALESQIAQIAASQAAILGALQALQKPARKPHVSKSGQPSAAGASKAAPGTGPQLVSSQGPAPR